MQVLPSCLITHFQTPSYLGLEFYHMNGGWTQTCSLSQLWSTKTSSDLKKEEKEKEKGRLWNKRKTIIFFVVTPKEMWKKIFQEGCNDKILGRVPVSWKWKFTFGFDKIEVVKDFDKYRFCSDLDESPVGVGWGENEKWKSGDSDCRKLLGVQLWIVVKWSNSWRRLWSQAKGP